MIAPLEPPLLHPASMRVLALLVACVGAAAAQVAHPALLQGTYVAEATMGFGYQGTVSVGARAGRGAGRAASVGVFIARPAPLAAQCLSCRDLWRHPWRA